MKMRKISIWAITILAASLLVAPAAHSQVERFSANLLGANEVPPINTAGSGVFHMRSVGSDISSRSPFPICHRLLLWPTCTSHRLRWAVAS